MQCHSNGDFWNVCVTKVFWKILLAYLLHKDMVRSASVSYHWKLTSYQGCGKAQLESPWTARSKFSCIARCRSLYPGRCLNVVYDTNTGSCTPVHPTAHGDPSPSPQPGELVYSEDTGRGLVCNTDAGFQLYQGCGAAVCAVHISVSATYYTAESDCQARNATLYIPDTFERFALMGILSPSNFNSWIGMKRIDGLWTWANGDTVEPGLESIMWGYGQPDEHEHDFCALVTPSHYKLHDAPCHYHFAYICEQMQSA